MGRQLKSHRLQLRSPLCTAFPISRTTLHGSFDIASRYALAPFMMTGSLLSSKPTTFTNTSTFSKLLAQVSLGLLHVGKALRKKSSRAKLGQGAKPVQDEPQSAAPDTSAAPEPSIPKFKLPRNTARPQEAAIVARFEQAFSKLPALNTSACAAPAAQGLSCSGSSDGSDIDSQPGSPTGVLHWLRPSRAKAHPEALALRYEQLLAAERGARLVAEAAAAAAASAEAAKAEELRELQEQVEGMDCAFTGMQQVNEGLRAKAARLQDQLTALMEVGDKDLKQSFCELQSAYGAARARLDAANYTIARLRYKIKAGQGKHSLCSVAE